MKKNIAIKNITLDALFLALLVVASQISIPFGVLKFTLQLLVVFLIADLLDLKNSIIVLILYIVIGLCGMPVFASFGGGISYLFSLTFGFVIGFIPLILVKKFVSYLLKGKNLIFQSVIGSILGLILLYIIGLGHAYFIYKFYFQSEKEIIPLLNVFILPYIPFDVLKLIIATIIVSKMKKVIDKYFKKYHFKTIDSTSTYLKENIEQVDHMTFVSSEFQTNGHGRMNRKWDSNKNENLMFSFVIKEKELAEKFSYISLSVAKALFDLLVSLNIKNVSIKWPNDLYVKDQKIAGILLEAKTHNHFSSLVVGVGLNVNATSFSKDYNATSLYLQTNKKYRIWKIKRKLYQIIEKELKKIKENDYSYLSVIRNNNYLLNKEVNCVINNKLEKVKVININDDNSLRVIFNNEEVSISSDEVTFHL